MFWKNLTFTGLSLVLFLGIFSSEAYATYLKDLSKMSKVVVLSGLREDIDNIIFVQNGQNKKYIDIEENQAFCRFHYTGNPVFGGKLNFNSAESFILAPTETLVVPPRNDRPKVEIEENINLRFEQDQLPRRKESVQLAWQGQLVYLMCFSAPRETITGDFLTLDFVNNVILKGLARVEDPTISTIGRESCLLDNVHTIFSYSEDKEAYNSLVEKCYTEIKTTVANNGSDLSLASEAKLLATFYRDLAKRIKTGIK